MEVVGEHILYTSRVCKKKRENATGWGAKSDFRIRFSGAINRQMIASARQFVGNVAFTCVYSRSGLRKIENIGGSMAQFVPGTLPRQPATRTCNRLAARLCGCGNHATFNIYD